MSFRNAILALPQEIRVEVDSLIEKQYSGKALMRHLKERYRDSAAIPSLPTILKYIRYYNSQKQDVQKRVVEEKVLYNLEDGITEVNNVFLQISRGETPNFDKIKVLEGLAGKCITRIHTLEDTIKDQKKINPAIEQAIVRYVTAVKDIMQSVNMLSGTHREDEKILIQMIRTEARGILDAVRAIIIDICPDKYDLFKEKLRLKLQERGIHALQKGEKPEENASNNEENEVICQGEVSIDSTKLENIESNAKELAQIESTSASADIQTTAVDSEIVENSGDLHQFSTSEVLVVPAKQPDIDKKSEENEKESDI